MGRILPSSRAMVLHQGEQCRWARGRKGWLIRAQKPRTKRISCKAQYLPTYLPACLPTYLTTCQPNFLPTCLPACLLTYLTTCLPAYLPAYLPTCLPTYLLTCLPTYLPACLPAYLPTYLPTYLPACLPLLKLTLDYTDLAHLYVYRVPFSLKASGVPYRSVEELASVWFWVNHIN